MTPLPLEYRQQLTNARLKKILFDHAALRYLEILIEEEFRKLEGLRRSASTGKFDLDKRMVFDDVSPIFPQVKKEIDILLGVSGIRPPALVAYQPWDLRTSYPVLGPVGAGLVAMSLSAGLWYYRGGSWLFLILVLAGAIAGIKMLNAGISFHDHLAESFFYSPLTHAISIAQGARCQIRAVQIPGILAHEYSHHIESLAGLTGMFSSDLSFFKEGFACAMERYIASLYREKEGSGAFVYYVSEILLSQMQEMSRRIRRALGLPGRKRDAQHKVRLQRSRPLYEMKALIRHMNDYAIGSVALFLLESKGGRGIYKDILEGRFDFSSVKF